MYQHFKAISEVGPTIHVHIQGRTAVNMTAATTLRCAELPGIIGVKEGQRGPRPDRPGLRGQARSVQGVER